MSKLDFLVAVACFGVVVIALCAIAVVNRLDHLIRILTIRAAVANREAEAAEKQGSGPAD